MSIATDARAYADAALEQGKTVLNQATAAVNTTNKRLVSDLPAALRTAPVFAPTYAAVGVADLAVETVAKRAESFAKRAEALPSEVATGVSKASELSWTRIAKAQDDAMALIADLRSKFEASVDSAKDVRDVDLQAKARAITDGYLAVAKNLFDTLSTRGEAKIADLRNDPRLAKFFGEFNDAAKSVQTKVDEATDKVSEAAKVVQTKVDEATDKLSDAAKVVTTKVDEVTDKVGETAKVVQSKVSHLVGKAEESTAEAEDAAEDSVESATDAVESAADTVASDADAVESDVIDEAPAVKAPVKKVAPARKSPAKKATTSTKPTE